MKAAGGQAHAPLPQLAVAFVATQLKAKAVSAAQLGLKQQADEAVQAGCEALMGQALRQMQALSEGGGSEEASGKRVQRALRVAMENLYGVFEALQTIMASDTYLKVRAACERTRDCICVRPCNGLHCLLWFMATLACSACHHTPMMIPFHLLHTLTLPHGGA